MSQTGEDARYVALNRIAMGVRSDVEGTYPEMDTDYGLWMEELVLGTGQWPYAKKVLVGVIDMGEAYQGVYVHINDTWEPEPTLAAGEMIDRILKERQIRSGL